VRLVDTAGLRDTECEVEQEGVKRARSHIEKSDLTIYVVDASVELNKHDTDNLKALGPDSVIVVLNKIDLGGKIKTSDMAAFTCVETSLLSCTGVSELKQSIRLKLESNIDMQTPPHAVISERHRQLLADARVELIDALKLLSASKDSAMVPVLSKLRTALESLGLITGRVYHDELLNAIFSRFCIGK
jgi:tRNA modification GTPase